MFSIDEYKDKSPGTYEMLKLSFCRLNKNNVPYDTYDQRIVDHILLHHHIFVMSGVAYIYENGCYQADTSGTQLLRLVKFRLPEEVISQPRLERIARLVLKDADIERKQDAVNQYPSTWINFKNGMLDVLTGEMHEHDPAYYSISQIPHNYYPGLRIEESIFNEFLKSRVKDPADKQMLYEYIGYCMTHSVIFQKFMILVGLGDAGKSKILEEVTRIVGEQNLAAVALQNLSDRFTTATLMGKIVNVCGDLSDKAMTDTSVVKQLTGEDLVKAEYKGGAVFFFKNRAKFIFSSNQLPKILDDRTNGFFRRLLIITFDSHGDYIDNLQAKLSRERDIEIVISYTVSCLRQALIRHKLTESDNSIDAVQRLRMTSDSIEGFIMEMCDVSDKNAKTQRIDLYEAYKKYCQEEDRIAFGKSAFFDHIRAKGFQIRKTGGYYNVMGIKFRFIDADSEGDEILFE